MSNNSVTVTKEDVEASGQLRAEQSALHKLKPIVSSLIDSVRGDDELVITCEIKKGEKKNEKSTKKSPNGDNSKSSKSGNTKKSKGTKGSNGESAGDGEGSASGQSEQELDPLAPNKADN